MSFNLVLVMDENGQQVPSYNDKGEVLLHDEQDDSYNYVPLSKELVESFPQLQVIDEPMDMVDDSNKLKAHWTYDATIMLINKYKHYQPYFADAIHKNVEVWDMIAVEFQNDGFSFCGNQCENRWKYVRGKYLKKKDNGGPGSTGDENYQFAYYKEMDDVLGNKPNVVPKYLASSESSNYLSPTRNIRSQPSKVRRVNSNSQSASDLRISSVRTNGTSSTANRKTSSTANSTSTGESSSQSSSNCVNVRSIDLTSSQDRSASSCDIESSSIDTACSSRSQQSFDTRGLNMYFDDDEEETLPTSPPTNKGKHRKEPWDENVQRQDRYHAEMMQAQRESMEMFKNLMSQVLDCFRKD